MVLESIMICLDNSEWMRNGDYSPSRFEAQNETVNYLSSAKTQGNPETNIGFLSMAGKRIDVHMTPTRNLGAIMTSLQKEVKIGGKSNFVGGLKTAQLVLKNRQNKNQKPRIIMFVGSPVDDDTKELVKLAKTFKKNSIAVDIINFGAENTANDNPEKIEQFIQACNSTDNSHLVNIPPGPHVFSDLVLTSSIMMESPGVMPQHSGGGGVVGAGNQAVDPNTDPELAMVLKMSMEEAKQKDKKSTDTKPAAKPPASASASAPASASAAPFSSTPAAVPTSSTPAPAPASSTPGAASSSSSMGIYIMEEDGMSEADLAQAIAMSMGASGGDAEPAPTPAPSATSATVAPSVAPTPAMTPAPIPATASTPSSAMDDVQTTGDDLKEVLRDKDFLKEILGGVGNEQLEIDDIISKLTGDDEEGNKEDQDKNKKKDDKSKPWTQKIK